MKNKGAADWFGVIVIGLAGAMLAVFTLGVFGLALTVLLCALLYFSPDFLPWWQSKRGYERLRYLSLFDTDSPTTVIQIIAIALIPTSLISLYLISGMFAEAGAWLVTMILSTVGLVVGYGFFFAGWGVKKPDSEGIEEVSAPPSFRAVLAAITKNFKALGAVIAALILPLCVCFMGVGISADGQPNDIEPAAQVESNGEEEVETQLEVETDSLASNLVETDTESTNTPEPTSTHTPTATLEPTHTHTPEPTKTATPHPSATPIPVPEVEINSNSVNLRGGPGVEYEGIGVGRLGDTFEVIASNQDSSWYNVRLENGVTAWVASSVVDQVDTDAFEAVEVAATIPAAPVVVQQPTATQVVQATVATEPEPTQVVSQPTSEPTATQPAVQSPAQVVIIWVDKRAEYVDIRNDGGTAQDLGGWLLRSEKGSQDCGLSGVIQPGSTLRIWAMSEDAGQGGFNCGFGGNIWNNSDPDAAILYDNAGQEVSRYCC